MSIRVRILILAALGVAFVGMRGLAPPRPSASGAFGHGPSIVLVHGLGSRAEHWLPVARSPPRACWRAATASCSWTCRVTV